jgi:hypothetical protein
MENLTIQQLNDLHYCVGSRYREIFKGYNELTEELMPMHLLEEANRLIVLLDIIYHHIKTK